MTSHKLWGEFETNDNEDTLSQNVDFSQMIELMMHQIPDIPSSIKPTVVQFPIDSIVKHTIELHEYARSLSDILEQTEKANADGKPIDALTIPPRPSTPQISSHHKPQTPINFVDKDECDFSQGKGPVILPLKPEDHQQALTQSASVAMSHLGVFESTEITLNVLADSLDQYLHTLTQLMRTIADREASGLHSGFPDIMSKVFADMRITDLKEFYNTRIVRYRDKVKRECIALTEAINDVLRVPVQQLKLEEVPELHFPAALSEVLTPSLEPGFQMLHSLEQDELHSLELLDNPHDDIKIEVVDYAHSTSTDLSSPSLSPRSKKKRKM